MRSQLIYERNINQNYFGVGRTRRLQPLHVPGRARRHDVRQLRLVLRTTLGKITERHDVEPLQRARSDRGRSHRRASSGCSSAIACACSAASGCRTREINDYTGKQVDAIDAIGAARPRPGPTRLYTDCAASVIVGCSGGRDDFLRLGISYDTRDFEPDPKAGVFVDAAVDAGTVALGSQYDYVRMMLAARGYWSPDRDDIDLVLAGRGVFEVQTSGTPFFSMDTFPFTEDPRTGLGGQRTMRGFRQDRFVGPVKTLLNGEARWTLGRTRVLAAEARR